jgi:hypothetical protein
MGPDRANKGVQGAWGDARFARIFSAHATASPDRKMLRSSSTARWFIAVPPKRNGAQKLRAALKLTADSKPSRRRRDHLGDRRR